MHKVVTPIKNLETIEKELIESQVGVAGLLLTNEKMVQLATPFLYQDKNIYVFFNSENELYDKIHFDLDASFTILKAGKAKKAKGMKYEPTYNFLSISIRGKIKSINDQKQLDDLRQGYLKKYKKTLEGNFDFSALHNVVIIDSEEIQAFDETGG